ncbi:MAG: glycoside hydrolase family 75 protein [Chitinophagaceae bacterium]
MRLLSVCILFFSCSFPAAAQFSKKAYKIVGNTTVYKVDSMQAYIYTAGFMIDADGAPKAYHKDDKVALDYLGNGGKPGNWWALVTDNGKASGNPVIQTASNPAPGYYISMTALENGDKNRIDPDRYVNSETIPYIAVPAGFSNDFKLGDIAFVYNKKNQKFCFAIFADIGPKNKIGEGSIKLANELGINSNPKKGGIESGIVYLLMKNSGQHKVLTTEQIIAAGKSQHSGQDIDRLIKLADVK